MELRLPPNFKLIRYTPSLVWQITVEQKNDPLAVWKVPGVTELENLEGHALVYKTLDPYTGNDLCVVVLFTDQSEMFALARGEEPPKSDAEYLFRHINKIYRHEAQEWFTIDGEPFEAAHADNGTWSKP